MRTSNDGDDDWYIFRKQDTQSHEMGKVLIRDFESGNAIIFLCSASNNTRIRCFVRVFAIWNTMPYHS